MPTTMLHQPQAPRKIGPWFAIVLVAAALAMFMVLAVFVDRRHTEQTGPVLSDTGDEGWISRIIPKATPTPAPFHPMPTPAPTMAVYRPVQAPLYQPHAAPTMSEEERERLRRYHEALLSDISIKTNGQQVLETPRLLGTGPDAQSKDSINVNLKPPPPHTVTAWTWIDGTLETGIDSDHPGDVLGRVSQDVRDSVSQTEVLIPAGSILHGWHGGREEINPNDTSLLVGWRDLEFPNGARIQLPDMPGTDPSGVPGFSDLIDHHYARTWAPTILISAITAAASLASHPTYGGYQGYDPEQQAIGSGAQNLSSHAIGQLGTDLDALRPTIKVEPGYHFKVLCTKDLVFSGAYPQ
jgi:type IV secretory pathway VirB10-like protein